MNQLLRDEKKIVFILSCVQFTHILDFVIMMPLGPQFMRVFQISPGQFGLLVSSYTVTASITALISSFFIDRYDRKKALLVLYAGFLLATLMCALSTSYLTLLLARAMAGGFGGLSGVMVFSVIGDAVRPQLRGQATGIVMSSFSVASVVGIPLGLFLAQRFDWHSPFLFIVAVGGCAFVYATKQLPSMKAHLDLEDIGFRFHEWWRMVSLSNHLRAFVFMFFLMMSNFAIIPFISPSLVSNVGVQEKDLFWVYLVGGSVNFFSAQAIGRLVDKHGSQKIYISLAIISIIPILFVTHLQHWGLGIAILAVSIFMISSSGRMVPALALINSVVPPKIRGRFMSVNSSVQQMGSGCASLISSFIVAQDTRGQLQNLGSIGWMSVAFVLVTLMLVSKFTASH